MTPRKKPDRDPEPDPDDKSAEDLLKSLHDSTKKIRINWGVDRPYYFILNEKWEPVPVYDVMEWATWRSRGQFVLKRSQVGKGFVSTVFLSLDHAYGGGPPVLWETMIFGVPEVEDSQRRYISKTDALRGHDEMVELAKVAWEQATGETPKIIHYGLAVVPGPRKPPSTEKK